MLSRFGFDDVLGGKEGARSLIVSDGTTYQSVWVAIFALGLDAMQSESDL